MIKWVGLLVCFTAFLLCAESSNAQRIFLSQQKNARNLVSNHIIGKMQDRYLLFSHLETAGQLRHYNNAMELISTIDIEYPVERSRLREIIRHDTTFTLLFEARSGNRASLTAYEYYINGRLKDEYSIVSGITEAAFSRFQIYRS